MPAVADLPRVALPAEVESALRELRNQTAALIAATAGLGARSKDISDRLGLHAKLGWQVWNLAFGPPASTPKFLLNEYQFGVLRKAVATQGGDPATVDRLAEATARLNEVMARHAGDREAFEMLLDANSPPGASGKGPTEETGELRWRRMAFAGNGFVFGVRARCAVSTLILFPSVGKPHHFSMVRMTGLLDLVRMRSGVRWPFTKLVVQRPDRVPVRAYGEPLVEAEVQQATGVPLVPDFCSQPLPPVERQIDGEFVYDNLLPGVVGQTGRSTVFTAEVVRDVAPAHGLKGGETAHFGVGVRTPSELLITDHFVHRTIFPGVKRELRVYSELLKTETRDDRDRLEVSESLEGLGQGLGRAATADVPGYRALLGLAFERIGFDPAEFEGFRAQLRYPPIPTSVMVRFALPPPPHQPCA